MGEPTQQEVLATSLPGPAWDGWYCPYHPSGEQLANGSDRTHCWGCGSARPERIRGSGDFSIGSRIWPGTSKMLEEMGELQQVLGKLIAVHGDPKHWDGDLRVRLVEEIGDLCAALVFFKTQNLTLAEMVQISERVEKKLALFREWHANPKKP